MSNLAIDFRNPSQIRSAGFDALVRELGPIGAIHFMRQFSSGYGDYTSERDKYVGKYTFEEIVAEIQKMEIK